MAANQYGAAPVSATQVGSYFVQQYYQVFQQQRESVHQFYNDSSSMMRINGDVSQSASDLMQIHQLIMSLNFTGMEIKTIKSFESWSGGILVVVSGSVKLRNFIGSRKFVQAFFLAPQEKGYFVLNDIFHFANTELALQPSVPFAQEYHFAGEELVQQPSVLVAQEENVDYQPTISTHLPDQQVSDYPLEEEAVDYAVHINGNEPAAVEYSYHDHHQQELLEPESELEPEIEVGRHEEETLFEDSSVLRQITMTSIQEPQPSPEEPVGEPGKLTYASILRAKGKSSSSISLPAITPRTTPAAGWDNLSVVSQPLPPQSTASLLNSWADTVEEASSFEEGESQSVYVKNLPSTVTSLDILQEFKNFGKVKHDGVFLKNRMDTGVCFAFVEFEDAQSVQNAVKASPIQLAGRQVYIEERRPNTGAARGGGRFGGGGRRGGPWRGRSFGRGNEQNGSYNRGRTSGLRT